MITHIVLFKLLHGTPEKAEEARQVLAGMAGKIPAVRHLEVGVDLTHSERSYDLALLVRFDSLDDLRAYQVHPVHVEVLKYMQEVRQLAIVVDYETP
jgi:heme-degrading monooxygenase HmoA